MQKKEEKRKNENKITVDNKHYYLHKIIWLDIVGNSTLAMDLLMKEIINLGGENIKLIIKNR